MRQNQEKEYEKCWLILRKIFPSDDVYQSSDERPLLESFKPKCTVGSNPALAETDETHDLIDLFLYLMCIIQGQLPLQKMTGVKGMLKKSRPFMEDYC